MLRFIYKGWKKIWKWWINFKRLNKYAENKAKDKTYAGDIEISTTTHYLGININILIKNPLCYNSYLFYENDIKTNEILNILYSSGNNYSLLIKRDNKIIL